MQSVVISFVVAWALTGGVLILARRFRLLDAPNQRSSHAVPTPTLGGLAIVGAVLLIGWQAVPGTWRSIGPASLLLTILVVDDIGHPLGVKIKAAIQLLAAAAWVSATPLTHVHLVGVLIDGWLFSLLASGWLVVWMNVFNFMDGIDGITGAQTIVTGVSLGAVFAILAPELVPFPLCLAAAAAGFLVFNLPPARIFMGDVGSAFVGLCVGVMTLQAMAAGISPLIVVLPLAVYLYDTSLTILRRALDGQNILKAHRQHLYQLLVRRGWSHGRVTSCFVALSSVLGWAAYEMVAGAGYLPYLLCLLVLISLGSGSMLTWHQFKADTDG